MKERYYLICFYVPQTLGTGQFRPIEGSNPHVGAINQVEIIAEYKVEISCPADKIN